MINQVFANKIEEYVKQKEANGTAKISAKGLLAPKRNSKVSAKEQQTRKDAIQTVGEYVYTLRQKRNELKAKRESNGSK